MNESIGPDQHVNVALVNGALAGPPKITKLASGSVVWNYDLITNPSGGPRHSVPIAWVDPSRPPSLKAGDQVLAVGSIRRRFFRAGGATQSRTELLADVVARAGSVRASKALARLDGILFER